MFSYTPIFVAFAVILPLVQAKGSFFGWGLFPELFIGNKRDLGNWSNGGYANETDHEGGTLMKRDNETTSTWYLQSTLSYMAEPFGACTSTRNVCPSGFLCACQGRTSSRCLPATITVCTECHKNASIYTGPSETDYMTTTIWPLTESLSYIASPSGQCGGTVPIIGTPWNSEKTACPTDQVCACQNGKYSRCHYYKHVTATTCSPRGTCTDDGRTLLPPTATAKMSAQCGGSCWTGPTNCPTIFGKAATCYTQISPTSGAHAICDTTQPANSAATITPAPVERL